MQTNTNIYIMYYGSEESKLIRERFGLLQLLDGAQHNFTKISIIGSVAKMVKASFLRQP